MELGEKRTQTTFICDYFPDCLQVYNMIWLFFIFGFNVKYNCQL